MSAAVHPAAPHHLPSFITAPGETDVLMVISLIMLLAIVVAIGVFYFRLHALPEQIAHKGQKVQFQVVAVLGLIALFTHNHIYWIAALILAFVTIPDFATPLTTMANSLVRIADSKEMKGKPGAGRQPKAARPGAPPPAAKTKEAGDA
ncbi:MAG: hypothetical protein VX871_11845 [Pseudomonadota bacterium]|nr:hypothetical protein [Pseudomonadota bacterium]